MQHFVPYHNPDGMGGPYLRSGNDFAIVTNKGFKRLRLSVERSKARRR